MLRMNDLGINRTDGAINMWTLKLLPDIVFWFQGLLVTLSSCEGQLKQNDSH